MLGIALDMDATFYYSITKGKILLVNVIVVLLLLFSGLNLINSAPQRESINIVAQGSTTPPKQTKAKVIEAKNVICPDVSNMNLRNVQNIPPNQISEKKSNFKDKVPLINTYGQKYNINPYFIAAVAAQESGWGTSNWAQNHNNYFGYAYCKDYSSFEASLEDFCKGIDENYLNPEGPWFEGYTVSAINTHYCEGDSWAPAVETIMKQIYKGEV